MVRAVLLEHRHWPDEPQHGVRVGDLLMCDSPYPRHAGPRRYFWLMTYGVQLVYEPFGWEREWYVDVVTITAGRRDGDECFRIDDATIDLVVEGHGPTYRILDLDELADHVDSGAVAPHAAGSALRDAQRFLDAFLHRGAPFPPPVMQRWFDEQHDYPPFQNP
jgi:hypothetical protein